MTSAATKKNPVMTVKVMGPEAKIEEYFKKTAENNGFLQYKFISGVTGVPDRIIIGHGTIAFVELKAAYGVLSERQKFVINTIRQYGGTVFIPHSIEDIDAIIESLKKENSVA